MSDLSKVGKSLAPYHLRRDLSLSDLNNPSAALAALTSGSRLAAMAYTVADLNSAVAAGNYAFASNAGHVPFEEDGSVTVVTVDASTAYQLARSNTTNKVFERRLIAASWGAWVDVSIATLSNTLNSQITALNNELDGVEVTVGGHTTDISTINNTLGGHTTRLNGIDTRIDGVDSSITGLGNTKENKTNILGNATVEITSNNTITRAAHNRKIVLSNQSLVRTWTFDTPTNLGADFQAIVTNVGTAHVILSATFEDGGASTVMLQPGTSFNITINAAATAVRVSARPTGLLGIETVITATGSVSKSGDNRTHVFDSPTPITTTLGSPSSLGPKWMSLFTNINAGDVTLVGTFDDGGTSIIMQKGQSLLVEGNGTVHRVLLRGGSNGLSGDDLILTGATTVLRASAGKTVVLNSSTAMTVTLDTPTNLGAKWVALFTNVNSGDVTLSGTFDDGTTAYLLRKGDSLFVESTGTVHRLLLKDQAALTVVEEFAPVTDVAYIDLANTPINAAAVRLIKGGIPQPPSAWGLSGNRLTLTGGSLFKGTLGEKNHVYITKSQPIGTLVTPAYSSVMGNGTVGPYTMPITPPTYNSVTVTVGAVVQPKDTSYYTLSGNQITFVDVVSNTTLIEFDVTGYAVVGVSTPTPDSVTAVAMQTADVPAIKTKLGIDLKLDKAGGTITGPLSVVNASGLTSDRMVVTGANDSAQIKLGRTGTTVGSGYIGADLDTALRVFDSALATVLQVNQSGSILMLKQPSFKATSAFTAASGPAAPLDYLFGTVQHNVGSCYNPITGRFTAPITGIYTFAAQALTRSGAGIAIDFRLNGATMHSAEMDRPGTLYLVASLTIARVLLAAGDYVNIQVSSGTAYGGYYDFFSGGLVG